MSKAVHIPPCGNPECSVSTGICDSLTFGSGEVDFYGYWEKPCSICARAHEEKHPKYGECWPFKKVVDQGNKI
jgi:hypothetical protein